MPLMIIVHSYLSGSAPPLNVQATWSSSFAPLELSWSPSSTLENITGYRIFYGSGQSILVPSYVTSIVFNFVENQDEVGQTVSIRSESLHLLPSELTNVMVTGMWCLHVVPVLVPGPFLVFLFNTERLEMSLGLDCHNIIS